MRFMSIVSLRTMQRSSAALLLLVMVVVPCDSSSSDGDSRWKGVSCCREAVVPGCAVGCRRATSAAELEGYCRRSHEAELYNCLTEQETLLFQRTKDDKTDNFNEDEELQEVVKCCRTARSGSCWIACEELQRAAPADRQAALTRLQHTACGQEDIGFWECQGGGPPIARRPTHRLELHCCPLADTEQCRQLCRRTYSLPWHDQGPRFETRCLDDTFGETRLRHCIRDAEAPCLPSSGRLHFCEGFTDDASLYRSWGQQADINAKNGFLRWMRTGALGMGFRNLSIVTTGRCKTELKRLACLLHLRPCRLSDHHTAQICRSDCIRLLETCLSPVGGEADPEILCELMSAPEPDCVRAMTPDTSPSLSQNSVELLPPPHRHQISRPCLPSLCGPGMVCRVAAPNQSTYVCLPGCRLSEVSGRMVALGSSVLLPPAGGATSQLSVLLCAPDPDGGAPRLARCASVTVPRSRPCDAFETKMASGSVVQRPCLSCVCVDGDLRCRTANECLKSSQALPASGDVTSRPDCVLIHSQRCVGSPLSSELCEVRPCPAGHRCLPHPDICVDNTRPCQLHTCVPETAGAIPAAVETCRRAQSSVTSVEQSDWQQPFLACVVPAEQCDVRPPPCDAHGYNGTVLPSCGSTLRLYFSGRRLAALGSPVPARSVLSALRRLVGTADCVLTGRLEAARQLTVTLAADRAAAAAVCRLEAEKLRVWLSSGSPTTAAEPALWPVVLAELVPQPVQSGGAAAGRPALLLILTLKAMRVMGIALWRFPD